MASGTKSLPTPRLEPITGLRVEGFKSFRDRTEVDIKPLTILAGRNSAGKSSLIQPLLLLKQTLEAPFDPGPILLDGPCARLTEAQQSLWLFETPGTAREWMTGIRRAGSWVETRYGLSDDQLELLETAREDGAGARRVFRPGLDQQELYDLIGVDAFRHYEHHLGPGGWYPDLFQERCTYLVAIFDHNGHLADSPEWLLPGEPFLHLIHLPGLRGNPERSFPITGVSQRFPGPFQPYTASVLLSWYEKGDDRLKGVSEDLASLGLTWCVEPTRQEGTRVELQVGRLPRSHAGASQSLVNIADVGFGVSQVMPVVVALRVAAEGQTVHIEQPELHLHPNAQIAMADLLLDAAQRGARVIIETHSSVLLKAIQVAVAEGRASEDLVALHWFDRDEEGATHITTASLDAEGAYGDWPVDFADVEMDIERRFIMAPMVSVREGGAA